MSRRSHVFVVAVLSLTTPIASAVGQAKGILLQIRPHAGDTLHMRLDQQTEMTGTRRIGASESSAWVVTTMKMFSRAIVERVGEGSTTVLAITDSVQLHTNDEHAREAAARAEEQLRGQRVRFRVQPNGLVAMGDGDRAPRELTQVVSVMPAAFPSAPIAVGTSWTREVPLPAGTQLGAALSGKLHVSFRLDSIAHGGDLAYVSMIGDLRPAGGTASGASLGLEKGSVSGTMLVDRRRGWLTDSHFNIVVSSVVAPPVATAGGEMHMQLRVTQHMHTIERR